MRPSLYQWLMMGRGATTNPFDRHVLACSLALVAAEPRPVTVSLGLSPGDLTSLLTNHFPHAVGLAADVLANGDEPLAAEEPDLRLLLVESGSRGDPIEKWLAHIIARRSLEPNHLWQDLGLTARSDLSALMLRHFAPLAATNTLDMKWKKFCYRALCQREGIALCKAPVCDECSDFSICFGQEEGEPLGRLALS